MAADAIKKEAVLKICITSEGTTIDSKVDSRFGRCRYFIFIDTDSGESEFLENNNAELHGGAGIQSAQLVISRNAGAVLTGHLGPNAFNTLKQACIETYTGVNGTVKEVFDLYKTGKLITSQKPDSGSKSGIMK